MTEQLNQLAAKLRQMWGNHPDAALVETAAKLLAQHEAAAAAAKTTRKTTTKKG